MKQESNWWTTLLCKLNFTPLITFRRTCLKSRLVQHQASQPYGPASVMLKFLMVTVNLLDFLSSRSENLLLMVFSLLDSTVTFSLKKPLKKYFPHSSNPSEYTHSIWTSAPSCPVTVSTHSEPSTTTTQTQPWHDHTGVWFHRSENTHQIKRRNMDLPSIRNNVRERFMSVLLCVMKMNFKMISQTFSQRTIQESVLKVSRAEGRTLMWTWHCVKIKCELLTNHKQFPVLTFTLSHHNTSSSSEPTRTREKYTEVKLDFTCTLFCTRADKTFRHKPSRMTQHFYFRIQHVWFAKCFCVYNCWVLHSIFCSIKICEYYVKIFDCLL